MERAPIRNRNREIRKVRVGDLRTNPANHRLHPDGQRAALDGILQEVGFVGTLIGFELSDGTVRLCDGHLRKDALDPDSEVEVCIVDLTPEEVAKVLATHDGIGALAQIDHQALEALMQQAQVETPALQAMLADMAERSLDGPEDEGAPLGDVTPEEGDWPGINQTVNHQFLVRCNDDELTMVKEFIGRQDLPDTRIGAAVLEQIKALVAP